MNGAEVIARISKNVGADFLTCSPHGEIVDAASALNVVVDAVLADDDADIRVLRSLPQADIAALAEMIFSVTNLVIIHGETPISEGRPGIRPLKYWQ